MTDFVVRDTRWRSVSSDQPATGEVVEVRTKVAGVIVLSCTFDWPTASWVMTNGLRLLALPTDEWRPEDDR